MNKAPFLYIILTAVAITAGVYVSQGRVDSSKKPTITPAPIQTPPNPFQTKIRSCPDEWIIDRQPCVYVKSPSECENHEKEYLIIEGERKEVKDYDLDWIKANCPVDKPTPVY